MSTRWRESERVTRRPPAGVRQLAAALECAGLPAPGRLRQQAAALQGGGKPPHSAASRGGLDFLLDRLELHARGVEVEAFEALLQLPHRPTETRPCRGLQLLEARH